MTIRTALSLQKQQFIQLERFRKEMGISRSAFFQNLIAEWLKRREERKLVKKYISGYKRLPESAQELAETQALMRLHAQNFETDEWSKAES